MKINGYIKALSFSTNLNKHKVLLDQNMINSITCKPEEVIMDTRHLSGEERQLISDIVKKKHAAIFAKKMAELGRTNVVQYTIPTTGEDLHYRLIEHQ